MEDVGVALNGVQQGKGSLGKLATETQAHDAFVDLMHQGTKTLAKSEEVVTTLQQDADALKRIPVVGAYIEDPTALLQRYNCERQRRFYNAGDLFEPGRAVLTAQGKSRLDALAPWLEGMKHAGSEVVIVAYADPHSADSRAAHVLTHQQSEAVCEYLKTKYAIQKMGWFSTRKVTPVGMGTDAPPLPEPDPLPPDRVEVQVFTP
jgi:phospholipid/cholesterol/gamma-HCH transport system substrate-binding protein